MSVFYTSPVIVSGGDNELLDAMITRGSYINLIIPDRITVIGNYAFHSTISFTGTLSLPSTLTTIGKYSFYATYLSGDLTIPESVTLIDQYAFGQSRFNGLLTLPSTISNIGSDAFNSCTVTGEVIIPASLTTISGGTFRNMATVYNFKMLATTPPTISTTTLIGSSCPINVPAANIYAYKIATNWAALAVRIMGYQTFAISDTFPEYAEGAYTTTTWYPTIADLIANTNSIASGTTVTTAGEYYCKLV